MPINSSVSNNKELPTKVAERRYSRAFWVTTLGVAGLIALVACFFWIAPRIQ